MSSAVTSWRRGRVSRLTSLIWARVRSGCSRESPVVMSARRVGAAVGQVHDEVEPPVVADGGVGGDGHVGYRVREPVVAAGRGGRVVHPLLDDRPAAVRGKEEIMDVDLVAVLDRVVVDLCREPREIDEAGRVDGNLGPARHDLIGRPAGVRALSAGGKKPELGLDSRDALLDGGADRGGHAGGMPVEPQEAAEGLEPEGVGEAAERLRGAEVRDDNDDDLPGEADHPAHEPGRGLPAVQRQRGGRASHARLRVRPFGSMSSVIVGYLTNLLEKSRYNRV